MYEIFACFCATILISALLVPFIRFLSLRIGATDKPNVRRINKIPMPTMGGLAIFIAFNFSNFVFLYKEYPLRLLITLFIAQFIVVLTGVIDDIYELKPYQKLIGITIAALIVYYMGHIRMTTITIPFFGIERLGILSLPITIIWILAITNALNLIDGLDGLATGIAIIALTTDAIIGYFFLNFDNAFISVMMFMLVASLLGFLPYNFYPATIYLGDTGALLIGFLISIFSLFGLKNATFISIIIPVIILGVPITDTIYAIIRRVLNNKPIMKADKHHLHHRLMQIGLSHKQTVLVIYGIALIFSFISLLYPLSSIIGSILLTIATLFILEIFVELIGLVGLEYQPLLNFIKKLIISIQYHKKNR